MKAHRFDPKLSKRFLATHHGFHVYSVCGFAVRNVAQPDEEFGNFATNDEFPDLIPANEIWIAEKNLDKEGLFFLANALTRLKGRDNGMPDETLYTSALNLERLLREKLTGEEFRAGKPHKRVPDRLYVQPYVTIPDERFPVKVWCVDGCLVRSWYKTDYTEGGHGYVYPWCPKDQIWVEADMDRGEWPFITTHEYLEHRLMRDEKLDYDTAHALCSTLEFDLRKRKGLQALLAHGRHSLRKTDLPRLAKPEVFEYVLKHYVRK